MLKFSHRLLLIIGLLDIFGNIAHAVESLDAKATIYRFYESYFAVLDDYDQLVKAENRFPYSKSLRALIARNEQVCKPHSDEVCGWGADGDPFLAAQDYENQLNLKKADFQIKSLADGSVQVSFKLFPSGVAVDSGARRIVFKMVRENDAWAVDDIFYEHGMSARKQIQQEIVEMSN